jgi:PAS fold
MKRSPDAPVKSLIEEASSYEKAIHPDDRAHVLGKLKQTAQSGHFEERFRIVRPEVKFSGFLVRGFPRKGASGKITRLGEPRSTLLR